MASMVVRWLVWSCDGWHGRAMLSMVVRWLAWSCDGWHGRALHNIIFSSLWGWIAMDQKARNIACKREFQRRSSAVRLRGLASRSGFALLALVFRINGSIESSIVSSVAWSKHRTLHAWINCFSGSVDY